MKAKSNFSLDDWSYYILRIDELKRKVSDACNSRDYEEAKFFAGELTIAAANLGAAIDAVNNVRL